ncbi:MAG: 6,7-dimethyl-8-ribityllumazine synthase [Rhodospirillaceae bacterium]|nr:6,7-dimethyl-8-ribityllumazine synthase [Rhodospirillaceae bacterium]
MAKQTAPGARDIPKIKGKVLILEARFHEEITELMVQGAIAVLDRAGTKHERLPVPGAFEIPGAIKFALNMYDGFVALGCVIRGETSHFDYVCGESARGLMTLAIEHNVAIGYGILTVDDHAQAIRRAHPEQLDKGGDAALACLRMIELKGRFLGGGRSS